MYAAEGKNFHDDSPDAITQLAIEIDSKPRQAVIMKNFL